MDNIGYPAQLLNCFKNATRKEYSSFAIVFILNTLLITLNQAFAETKVVTSLYNKSIEKDFGSDFKQFMEFRDAKPELLTDYNDKFDFEELGKLAIDYSDGVIQAVPDASKQLLDYATAKNVPLLGYQEDFADAYEAFYESLYADEAK